MKKRMMRSKMAEVKTNGALENDISILYPGRSCFGRSAGKEVEEEGEGYHMICDMVGVLSEIWSNQDFGIFLGHRKPPDHHISLYQN